MEDYLWKYFILLLDGLDRNEHEMIGKATKVLEKLGFNRASEDLKRHTFCLGILPLY